MNWRKRVSQLIHVATMALTIHSVGAHTVAKFANGYNYFYLGYTLISANSSYVLHVHCSYMYIADHKKRSKSVSTPINRNETPKWEEEIVAENKDEKVEGDGAVFMEEKPAVSEGRKEGAPRREKEGGREKKDNEYILDGFDFSTGMCVLYVSTRQYGRRGRSLTIIVCVCVHIYTLYVLSIL